jgi:pimeloyl-ACP methyl ester carboxylesterase
MTIARSKVANTRIGAAKFGIKWRIIILLSEEPSALADSILSQLKKGKTVKVEDQNLAALFHPSVQPYLISWMAFEPQEEIKKLQIPVLILQGNTDLQVMVKDAENLSQAKPNAKYYIIDGMNHVLKNASSDRNENLASYNNPLLAIDLDLCAAIIQFCK